MLAPFTDRIYAIVRIVTGLMYAFHGQQKLFGWLMPYPLPKFGTQIWVGGVLELACGLLIALGLFGRCAAFVASGTMAVAYWQFHVFGEMNKLDGIAKYLPGCNGGEPAVVYCFLFLFMACKGSGPLSIDARREKKAESK